MQITIDRKDVKITNLDKIFWPEQGFTKGDIINYYIKIYPYIQEYLKDRPISLNIFPDGISGKSFYQKNCPDYAPEWLTTIPVRSGGKRINYIMINNLSDLVWVANRASIELHTWFSTSRHQLNPDFAVFDLDPGEKTGFKTAVEVSLIIKSVLDKLNLISFLKTSGKRGLHIYIPINPIYKYPTVKSFLKFVAKTVINIIPDKTTIEWRKEKRKGKLHIDYRQNARGKTIPAPYSLRPTANATVSTPLTWEELKDDINPVNFNLNTIYGRIRSTGNIWSEILNIRQTLPVETLDLQEQKN